MEQDLDRHSFRPFHHRHESVSDMGLASSRDSHALDNNHIDLAHRYRGLDIRQDSERLRPLHQRLGPHIDMALASTRHDHALDRNHMDLASDMCLSEYNLEDATSPAHTPAHHVLLRLRQLVLCA